MGLGMPKCGRLKAGALAAPGLAVLFGLLPAPHLHAEVFWRIPKTADTVLRQMGGTRVYASDVQLNGAPGALTAYAFAGPLTSVGADLAGRLGLPRPSPFATTCMTHVEKDQLSQLYVLPSPAGQQACLVLSFKQTLSDFARSRERQALWPDGLPALNATPLFSAVCSATRTTFVTAETPAAPEAAVQEASQTLLAAGWAEATPAPASATFKLFAAGKKQCVLLAVRHPQTGQTTISLLQREGATP